MSKKDDVPLYTTQYGGLTEFIGEGGFVWVKKPDNDPRFANSDYVPHDGLVLTPANSAAREHEARCKARQEEWEDLPRRKKLADARTELVLVEVYAQEAGTEDESKKWAAVAEELKTRIAQLEAK